MCASLRMVGREMDSLDVHEYDFVKAKKAAGIKHGSWAHRKPHWVAFAGLVKVGCADYVGLHACCSIYARESGWHIDCMATANEQLSVWHKASCKRPA